MKALEVLKEKSQSLSEALGRPLIFMEVCGTHTVAISKMGIRSVLSPYLDLRSGPGCPVCVTDQRDIEYVLSLAEVYDVTIATFGDMMKVPGRKGSLERKRAEGVDVRIFYSPLDTLSFAERHPEKEIVFLGVGFETTIPSVAVTILEAEKRKIKNFSVLSLHKLIPPALSVLLEDKDIRIDGLILPGHVSTILGRKTFDFISERYHIPSVISGFEERDIIKALFLLLKQIEEKRANVENGYERLVKEEGNIKAKAIMEEVFEKKDALWRGFGSIPESGLKVKDRYSLYDAEKRYLLERAEGETVSFCLCGEIIKGKAKPTDCPLFSSPCTPKEPVGPCMVSSEGACSAYYHFGEG